MSLIERFSAEGQEQMKNKISLAIILILILSFFAPSITNAQPPVFEPVNDITVAPSLNKSTTVNFTVKAADPEGGAVTISLDQITRDGNLILAAQIRDFSFDTSSHVLSWYPRPSASGKYVLTFKAIDPAREVSTLPVNVTVTTPPICNGTDTFCTYMKTQAINPHGYTGIVYKNADGGHAPAQTSWSDQMDSRTEGWGLQFWGGLSGEITFTNSSTAWSGLGGDNNADGMDSGSAKYLYDSFTNPGAPLFGFYPGHHSDGRLNIVSSTFGAEGHFGKFIYTYPSIGSSGSELTAIVAYMKTAGAFRNDVFEFLLKKGTLMATISMLDRLTRVDKNEQRYMSIEANPSFFASSGTRLMDMVIAANAITMETVPPMPKIELTMWNDPGVNGISYFEEEIKEPISFTTPMAVATIYRETQLVTKVFELDASKSFSPNGTEITEYNWVVTKGNQQNVRIIPLNANHSRVRIEIDYHGEVAVPLRTNVMSNLVEVALFVRNSNGQLSPPAFFTSYSMRNETRVIENNRLKEISYNTNLVPWENASWQTPLSRSKAWVKDVYNYDANGALLGWDRYMADGSFTSYTADGKLIMEKDASGKPVVVKNVQYVYDSALKILKPVISEEGIPAVSISPLKQPGSSGKSLNYVISIRNNDSASCTADIFGLSSSLPLGWSSVFSPNSVVIAPGASASVNWAVTSPADIPDGNYSVTANIYGSNTSYHNAVIVGTYEIGFPADDMPLGDVNGDKAVNSMDVQACVNHILGNQDWTSTADVNKDGVVNSLDVQRIVNIILGV